MKKILLIAASIFALAGCVKDELYPFAAVSDLANTIAYDETTAVTVTATVTAFVDITEVNLIYSAGGAAEETVAMTASGSTYSGVIPAQAMDTEVTYYVKATTSGGTVSSAEGTYTVGVIPIDFSPLKLNEINGNDKFIEIYNSGSEDIDIKGIYLQKDLETKWTASENKVVAAGGYLLLYSSKADADAQASVGEAYIFDGGISASKAVRVQIFDPKGNELDDFNMTVAPASAAPASYGRVPDGTGEWYYTEATPGATNGSDTTGGKVTFE